MEEEMGEVNCNRKNMIWEEEEEDKRGIIFMWWRKCPSGMWLQDRGWRRQVADRGRRCLGHVVRVTRFLTATCFCFSDSRSLSCNLSRRETRVWNGEEPIWDATCRWWYREDEWTRGLKRQWWVFFDWWVLVTPYLTLTLINTIFLSVKIYAGLVELSVWWSCKLVDLGSVWHSVFPPKRTLRSTKQRSEGSRHRLDWRLQKRTNAKSG